MNIISARGWEFKHWHLQECYKPASQRAMRAKGRAMRAMRVMRATVEMLRIFIS